MGEFVSGGSLQFHLQARLQILMGMFTSLQKQGAFPSAKAQFYAAEALLALWFLHDNGVAHRNLKLTNMLLAPDGHLKLVDFGLGKAAPAGQSGPCCSQDYCAPEVFGATQAPASADFWALGVALFKMLTGLLVRVRHGIRVA